MPTTPPSGNALNALGLFFCINLYFLIALGPESFSLSIFDDDGAISILTICLILATQVFVLYEMAVATKVDHRMGWVLLAYILQVYVMRETDFHRSFTATNVTKGSFYLSADNPFLEKLIAGTVLILFLLALVYLATKYAKACLSALAKRTPWAVAALIWFLLLFLSQLLDKSALNDAQDLRIKNIEEMLEFSAAIYLFLTIVLYKFGRGYDLLGARAK